MSVARHLGIVVDQYDERIRTFIPHYREMLDEAAGIVGTHVRTIVDLGVGTGALAARCLSRAPRARLIGLDRDPEMLAIARTRLGANVELICRDFLRAPLPEANAMVASFALHHVPTRASKGRLFRRVFSALRPEGVLVSADYYPAVNGRLARAQHRAWQMHLRRSYTRRQAAALFRSWAREDVHLPLDAEVALLRRSGFAVEVVWRREGFAVIQAHSR